MSDTNLLLVPQAKIVLVTPGQPALNPRLLKEADALTEAGYNVLVIYAYWNSWGDNFTQQMLPAKKWTAIMVGGHPVTEPLTYFYSRIIFKFLRWMFINLGIFRSSAIARSVPFLMREAKKHQADLYIGHNLGALPAIAAAAKKYNSLSGFDAEDFHRLETGDDLKSTNYLISKKTEDKYFDSLSYLSASSPEISAAYKLLYPNKDFVTLLNVFDNNEKQKVVDHNAPIKLFWFSQTVGKQRGLQDVIYAINELPDNNFELHLLGYISVEDKQYFTELAKRPFLYFYPPIAPKDVINFGAQFDIGLAIEPGFCTNNRKALSNKLFSYLHSGLAVLATNTEAQGNFLKANPEIGKSYDSGDIETLKSILLQWQASPALLKNLRDHAIKAAATQFNWKKESEKFLALVKNTLKIA